MQLLARVVLGFSISFIIVCLILFFLPLHLEEINRNLGNVDNLISFLSTIFSAFALLIASAAFLISARKPQLFLKIMPYDMSGKDTRIKIPVNYHTKKVVTPRSRTEWQIFLTNKGDIGAKNVVVELLLEGVYLQKDAFSGWVATHHEHGEGWYGFRWYPSDNEVIHKDFPKELPTLYFWKAHLNRDFSVKFTVVADDFKSELSLPVGIELVEYE